MLINNTINTSGHFGGAKPPKDSTQEILKKLEKKSNVGHVHKKSDIEDFAHTHDERYYRKDISELNLLLSGNGTPNYEQGEHDDLYIDELNGNLYKKVQDAWILKTSLKGNDGQDGKAASIDLIDTDTGVIIRVTEGDSTREVEILDGTPSPEYDDTALRQLIQDNLKEAKEYTDTEIANFDFVKIVDTLPDVGLPNKVYFVPKIESDTDNLFDEYAWINNKWEYFGIKVVKIDLTDINKNIEDLQNTKADKSEIPIKVSELVNDIGFITADDIPKNGDYNLLTNKPQIEGVELQGNKTLQDLSIQALTNSELENLINLQV